MARSLRPSSWLPALLAALVLSACGGGGDNGTVSGSSGGSGSTSTANNTSGSQVAATVAQDPGMPAATGDTATDGINRFNFRRQQMGLAALTRNAQLDAAALGHSTYQKINNIITHVETPGNAGFIGATLEDRLTAAGYRFNSRDGYVFGEVISATSGTSGATAAEDLIGAIYHRFVAFEPLVRDVGGGAATTTATNGKTYFTADFGAAGITSGGLKAGEVAVYPFPGQQSVPRNFFSDNETPDPVPDRNEVGYPISVHANRIDTLSVQSFTLQPHGGAPLAVRLLSHATDAQTIESAAAIVPLSPLAAGTTYDAHFVGSIGNTAIDRSWSFTTQ